MSKIKISERRVSFLITSKSVVLLKECEDGTYRDSDLTIYKNQFRTSEEWINKYIDSNENTITEDGVIVEIDGELVYITSIEANENKLDEVTLKYSIEDFQVSWNSVNKELNEIILKIKLVNDERIKNGEKTINEDDTNEIINDILCDYFLEEKQNGIDIDSFEFLEEKFGTNAELVRDAEGGYYYLNLIR